MSLNIYLSGEIHTDWRDKIIAGCQAQDLPSIGGHRSDASDAAGDAWSGQPRLLARSQSAKVNAMRIQTAIEKCDVAVIRFGDGHKQWNAAFDAGYCAAKGKPYITLHVKTSSS